ncbi:MAG: N-formylglutamate amidohydrolase [Sphingomonas fennica]
MSAAWTELAGGDAPDGCDVLVIADHASATVPAGIDLGVPADAMRRHIAVDIGVAAVAARLGFRAVLGGVSRLVIDYNREADSPGLIPIESDGTVVPGNVGADREARLADYYRPYHDHVAQLVAAMRPRLIVSLHSFTPQLATRPEEARPWEIGILYNRDERAARIALPLLGEAGVLAGDNLPYSGRVLNATMNAHAEANGIPYLGIEVRQDLIGNDAGAADWAARLRPIILSVAAAVG